MSYPPYGGGGYPPQQPGYGYPPQQPGYPPAQPGYGQPSVAMPDPYGGYPPTQPAPSQQPYPPAQGGGQPYAYPGQAPGGYPPQTAGGYPGQPPAGGYPGQPAPGGYPGQPPAGGYPGQPAPGGYPAGPAPGGYPAGPAPGGYPGGHPGQPAPAAHGGGGGHQGGGVPHISQPSGQGTVKPHPNFDAEEDAKVLRKAMKGMGTDEKAIISILAKRSNNQRQEIKNRFKTMYGKDLVKELKSEVSGRFEDLCEALLETPTEFDTTELKEAMSGAGTDERALIEILCTRSNKEIKAINACYKTRYSKDLEKALMSETSGHFRRLLVSMSMGNRIEGQPVDVNKAKQDAKELYEAGEKKLGTDESKFNSILCSQSYEQLRLVFAEYKALSKKSLEQVIKSEMSGDLEDGMLAVYGAVENKHKFFAERLHNSMKGAGTKDRTLIRIIASRCEIDMVQIKGEFQKLYGKSLESFIQGDTSGDYEKFLLALVTG